MKKILFIAALLTIGLYANAQEAIYTVKSGKITMEAGMGGMRFGGMGGPGMRGQGGPGGPGGRGPGGAGRSERGGEPRQFPNPVIYFDDYGAKQVTVTEFNGNTTRTLVIDGKNVMVNDAEKTAREMPQMGAMSNRTKINFSALTDKVIKTIKIKELGEEEVAGKLCKKYSYSLCTGCLGKFRKLIGIGYTFCGITLEANRTSYIGNNNALCGKVFLHFRHFFNSCCTQHGAIVAKTNLYGIHTVFYTVIRNFFVSHCHTGNGTKCFFKHNDYLQELFK